MAGTLPTEEVREVNGPADGTDAAVSRDEWLIDSRGSRNGALRVARYRRRALELYSSQELEPPLKDPSGKGTLLQIADRDYGSIGPAN